MANDNYITFSIPVSGTTATPTQIQLKGFQSAVAMSGEFVVRARVCNDGTFTNSTNAVLAPVTGKGETIVTHTSNKDLTIRSNQTGTAATGTLTISGVVIDGQTVTIGDRVYEFDTNDAVTSGRVAVDISGGATASEGTLTLPTQPTAGDTMTIGSRTYSFVANATADNDGEISVGTSLATAKTHIVAAINGTDDVNEPNAAVSAAAFSSNDCVLTALVPGAGGNAIVTTETFTAVGNVFDAATLGTTTAGVSCIAATAVTALVAAITGDTGAVVTAADGAGDTVVLTATTVGTGPNAYATTETMANGAFGAVTLTGGVAATPGEVWVSVTNATAETVTLRIGQPDIGGIGADCTYAQDITHAAP